MTTFGTKAGILGMAGLVALGLTLSANQATGRTSGAADPTVVALFERSAVGGRTGCETHSWPYVAPECLEASDGHAVKAVARRF